MKDRDRKDRGRGRGGGGFNSSEGYRSRRTHRAGSEDDVGSWNTYNGQYIPPPTGAPPRSAAPGSAAGGMAANRSSGSFHSQNDFCYKCTQTGHRSSYARAIALTHRLQAASNHWICDAAVVLLVSEECICSVLSYGCAPVGCIGTLGDFNVSQMEV